MNIITPFVYRSLLDAEILRDVEKVKNRIEDEHLSESYLNVKLGVGGIREIEFFVQTFQLLYGGSNFNLRSQKTLNILLELADKEIIPKSDAKALKEAYFFLRKVEHSLQLREERQIHTIPTDILQQQQIARNLSYLSLIHISEPTRPY